MSAKRFIITSLLGFSTLLIAYIMLVDKLVIPERHVPYSYKQFLLQTSSAIHGKVIVSAGSNAIHGIDSSTLADYFKTPVFTYADNANYPLRAKLFSLAKYTNPGDIVLLPLEWFFYSTKKYLAENYINALADEELRLEFYFNSLPIQEKLRFIFSEYPLQQVVNGLLTQDQISIRASGSVNSIELVEEIHSDNIKISFFIIIPFTLKFNDIAILKIQLTPR